ncbi:hypothetical protein [Aureispira anguillae]|uniref:Uncharacterized protein n=1 Tax=Aureispira anguillae TaxID=2864201 RepID=A0A916DWK0_9BACT|nr:hypothetical protein [Aureispira anguillae]BDS15561.1 hypothetical protein AsAng_0063450 [Aureispira anguillae]
MKNIITLIICYFILLNYNHAQYKGVFFDDKKMVFGENQPLPAESHIMLQGFVKSTVGIVELDVLEPKGRKNRLPLYTNQWKRSADSKEQFMLPINYKLKGSAEYDLNLKYYSSISKEEQEKLGGVIQEYLFTYLEQVIIVNRNSLSLEQNERQIMRSLNKIVHKGLSMFRNKTNTDFEGFSDLIKLKLKQIATTSLAKGKVLFQDAEKGTAKVAYRDKLLKELRTMIGSELRQYMNLDWFKMIDNKYIDNYSTEKSKRTIAIQAGFGGAYLSGSTNSLAIGASPFIGFAFPLSKRSSQSKVLNNLSINFGVFLLDFQGANNKVVSGPIFKRPTYVGLSYKLFRFVHFNAGATFLEDAATAGQFSGIEKRVYIRPFIGVSAQVDLWLDFSK